MFFDHDSNVQSATLTMKLRIIRSAIKTQLKMIFNDFKQGNVNFIIRRIIMSNESNPTHVTKTGAGEQQPSGCLRAYKGCLDAVPLGLPAGPINNSRDAGCATMVVCGSALAKAIALTVYGAGGLVCGIVGSVGKWAGKHPQGLVSAAGGAMSFAYQGCTTAAIPGSAIGATAGCVLMECAQCVAAGQDDRDALDGRAAVGSGVVNAAAEAATLERQARSGTLIASLACVPTDAATPAAPSEDATAVHGEGMER